MCMQGPEIDIVRVVSPVHLAITRSLMEEYASLPHIAGRWDNYADEIAALPGNYAPPTGNLLLAYDDDDALGCVALQALEPPQRAEMKRLYVRPQARGRGVGEKLIHAILESARCLAYRLIRLDTAPELVAAQSLYRRLGFREIAPYRDGLLADAVCFEYEL